MIGRIERLCDRARADARAGHRARSDSMTPGDSGYYMNAWRREAQRMAALGKLPQLDLFRHYQTDENPLTEDVSTV